MKGSLSHEVEVKVGAREAWKLYGQNLNLAKFAEKQLPQIFHKIDVLEGNGDPGTIINVTFPPDTPMFTTYTEKFTVIDDKKMLKEVEVIEGGYLDLGFTLFRVRIEIIKGSVTLNSSSSCIVRLTIEYDLKEEHAANASFVSIQPLADLINAAANYLLQNQVHPDAN